MGIRIGHLHVRRSAFIRATPERVWEEFTSFERLAAWFGQGHRLEAYEPRLGSRIVLNTDPDGDKGRFGGEILVFEPGRELSFSEDWESEPLAAPCVITIRLSPLYDGCHVELFHHGFERLGDIAGSELEGHEAGWHTRHLESLRAIVEG